MSIIDTLKEISNIHVPNIDADSNLGDILTNQSGASFSIINLLFFVAGMAFFLNTVFAGWNYIFSTGDPKKASAATARLRNGFLGIVIVLASFLLVRLISTFIGFDSASRLI